MIKKKFFNQSEYDPQKLSSFKFNLIKPGGSWRKIQGEVFFIRRTGKISSSFIRSLLSFEEFHIRKKINLERHQSLGVIKHANTRSFDDINGPVCSLNIAFGSRSSKQEIVSEIRTFLGKFE